MEAIVSRTLSVHKEHEVLLKLEAAGLCDDLKGTPFFAHLVNDCS